MFWVTGNWRNHGYTDAQSDAPTPYKHVRKGKCEYALIIK